LGLIKPPVGKQGLLNRISGIVGEWKKLGSPENVRIRLFTHYPTFALIVLDHNQYFFYPYGFSTLGNFSPIICFTRERGADDSAIQFFDQQMQLVSERAYPAELLLKEPKHNQKYLQELHPFALYVIPRENTPLYEIGSQVLGYDIRCTRNTEKCPWPNYVGIANNYGFHVTICDVLYFASSAEIDYAVEEVRFILKEFHPFFLDQLRVASGVPDGNSVSLVFEEKSGALEALHTECVFRVYRRAICSNYSSRVEEPLRDGLYQRAEMMIERYHAPYILREYKPHFTLLTKVPADKMQGITDQLNDQLCAKLQDRLIVDSMCVLTKSLGDAKWRIRSELYLG
jgi:hypothetical protein